MHGAERQPCTQECSGDEQAQARESLAGHAGEMPAQTAMDAFGRRISVTARQLV
jgi:hypothetical protein